MSDFKTRLLDEKTELEHRIENYNAFIVKVRNDKTSTLTDYHLAMLHLQLNAMSSYLMILNLRINDLDMNDAEKELKDDKASQIVEDKKALKNESLKRDKEVNFIRAMAVVINEHNIDDYLNISDYILADHLNDQLHQIGNLRSKIRYHEGDATGKEIPTHLKKNETRKN